MKAPPPLNSIESKPLRERILETIRDAIIRGDFKPGQQLREVELSSQLGVSRAPLREALQKLSSQGLVESIPYHGTRVSALTKSDVEELYSMRSVLETFAVQRIITQNNPENVTVLRKCYVDMLEAAEAGNLHAVTEIDCVFHDTLIELSQHSLLQTTWYSASMRFRQVMALLNRRNTDLKQIAYNHIPIMEAIQEGDEQKAVELIKEHVAASGILIAEGWDQNGEEGTNHS